MEQGEAADRGGEVVHWILGVETRLDRMSD